MGETSIPEQLKMEYSNEKVTIYSEDPSSAGSYQLQVEALDPASMSVVTTALLTIKVVDESPEPSISEKL